MSITHRLHAFHLPHHPVLLEHATLDYLHTLPDHERAAHHAALESLNAFLGQPAPLLAYTRLTGDAWVRSLPAPEQAAAAALLGKFRAFLRDHGWLDAARPVNQPD